MNKVLIIYILQRVGVFTSPLIALLSSVDKVEEVATISDENREVLEKLAHAFLARCFDCYT